MVEIIRNGHLLSFLIVQAAWRSYFLCLRNASTTSIMPATCFSSLPCNWGAGTCPRIAGQKGFLTGVVTEGPVQWQQGRQRQGGIWCPGLGVSAGQAVLATSQSSASSPDWVNAPERLLLKVLGTGHDI